jgi:uncharacterized protein (TIGR00369 family)
MGLLENFNSSFVNYVGIDVESLNDGEARISLLLRDEHLNSGGIAHGGVLATLADTAAGAAAFGLLPVEKMAVTTDFQLSCLKSSRAGCLKAVGLVIHHGRRLMRAEVKITANDTLIATAGVSFMVIDRPAC